MKKEKNDNLKLAIFWIISFGIIAFILFLMCFKSSAASDQDYFPMEQNTGGGFTPDNISIIENYFDLENNYIVMYKAAQFSDGVGYAYALSPKDHGCFFGEKNNDLIHFSLYYVGDNTGVVVGRFDIAYSGQTYNTVFGGNVYPTFYNLVSSNYDQTLSYASNYQVMTNNTETAKIVLLYDDGVTIPDGDTARDDMEKPDVNDYIPSWNNRPSFDGSTVENALSSIWDITIWTAENTRDTIKGVGEFLGDTIRWTSQKIIDNIRGKIDEIKTGIINAINGVTSLVQDIKGIITGIGTAINYIKEPLDTTTVQATITNSTAFGDVSTITSAFGDFKAVFDSTNEPTEYKIPLHLENISILGQTQTQYIDLAVIASTRPLIRAFCWVVTTFSLFVTVIDAIPSYLKGGDE